MKNKLDILGYIIVVFILVICLKIYRESDIFNLKCILSSVDGKKYCVRERNKLQPAADLLAKVTSRLILLVQKLDEAHPNHEGVRRLVKGFNPKKINETLPTSEYTAYSENKGEKLAFCLNKKKGEDKFIDIETLTFVGIHELGHIMSKTIGHNTEFWQNFKFLLTNAKEFNIYQPVDYKTNPVEYCGMTITDSPYYDY
jgi:hypothetical protein